MYTNRANYQNLGGILLFLYCICVINATLISIGIVTMSALFLIISLFYETSVIYHSITSEFGGFFSYGLIVTLFYLVSIPGAIMSVLAARQIHKRNLKRFKIFFVGYYVAATLGSMVYNYIFYWIILKYFQLYIPFLGYSVAIGAVMGLTLGVGILIAWMVYLQRSVRVQVYFSTRY